MKQKKRYISPEEKQQIIDELRLVPKEDVYFQKLLMSQGQHQKKDIYLLKKGNKLSMN